MRVAYFDCYSGISGDMILGALVDLGVDLKSIRKGLATLDLKGYQVKSLPIKRGMISGTKVQVKIPKSAHSHHHSRNFTHIKKMIESSGLPPKVKNKSVDIFHRIAKAEASVHRTTINKVHFHEVGAVDSIVDIVGGVLAMESLNVEKIFSSPLNTGEGSVLCEHGILPVPAPATVKLLQEIPCYSSGIKKELTTPTGAALIGAYAEKFCSLPTMKILGSGYGAGDHIIEDSPNMLRILLGEMEQTDSTARMQVIETNIDDMNPEFYEHVMESLFAAGAVDVFFVPIIMKKNRPAIKLSALAPIGLVDKIARILLSETSTFGVRFYEVERIELNREFQSLKTPYGSVKIKIGRLNGAILQYAPEYDECKKIARKKNIPIKKVYEDILRLAEQKL